MVFHGKLFTGSENALSFKKKYWENENKFESVELENDGVIIELTWYMSRIEVELTVANRSTAQEVRLALFC